MKQLGEVQHKLGSRLMLTNPGKAVEKRGKKAKNGQQWQRVYFLNKARGKNSGHGRHNTDGLDFRWETVRYNWEWVKK